MDINLKNYNLSTPNWTLNGKEMWARVVDIYDADKSKISENRILANKAKLRMVQLCGVPNIDLDKTYTRKEIQQLLDSELYCVWIKCKDWDKYGRLLAHVYKDNIELANVLIEEKLAYAYYGGTKLNEEEQVKKLL